MKKSNIAVLSVSLLVVFAAVFTACGKATPDPNYNYRVTGQFAGWDNNYDEKFMMTPVAKSDERLKSIKTELKDAQYVYIYEYTPDRNNLAGWNISYTGTGNLDGIFAVKFIRFTKDSSEASGWLYDMWIPSKEAGGLKNLSPNTLFVPKDRTDEERDAAADGLGSNNDNPVLLKGSVTYYIVFAVFKDKTRGMGAVVK